MHLINNKNQPNPFLIVAIPCYNEEKFIELVVTSVLNQTLSNFQLLIFDNASTDNTREILTNLSLKDDRIYTIYFDRHLSGLNNINRCLQNLPLSKYTALRAANDILAPNYLRKTLEILESNPRTAIGYSPGVLYDSQKQLFYHNKDEILIDTSDEDIHSRLEQVISIYSSPYPFWGVYRTDIIRQLHFESDNYGADHIFVCEAAVHGFVNHTREILEYKSIPIKPPKTHFDVWKSWHPLSVWHREESSQFLDIDLKLPFLSMIEGHLKMFHRLKLGDSVKFALQESMLRIITNRFRQFIIEESLYLKSLASNPTSPEYFEMPYLNKIHMRKYETLSEATLKYL